MISYISDENTSFMMILFIIGAIFLLAPMITVPIYFFDLMIVDILMIAHVCTFIRRDE